MPYLFTCPLEGCNHTVMTSTTADSEIAAEELVSTAEKHLQEKHPDTHKQHEEVEKDIRAHMST